LWHDDALPDQVPSDNGHRPSDQSLQPSALSPEPSDRHGDAPRFTARVVAIIEVLICSDYLTQFTLGGTLAAFGYQPFVDGKLSVRYVVVLSLGDAILLLGLILVILHAHGERPRDVLFGRRPIVPEIVAGVPMILVALGIGIVVLLSIQRFAPGLHTVTNNPLQELLRSPRDAWLFALVVLAAGGVREEVQRAFLLHRFDVWLGGPVVGVVVTSVAFGAGHLLQGADATVATGLLGAFWGVVYLRRRSCVAPMVSHAGFDLMQIVQFLG
jgi:membrane protease YdiL (CAAX protease family)